MERKQFINDPRKNLDIVHYLEENFDYRVDEFKRDYLTEIIPCGKVEFIKQIAESIPEMLVNILQGTAVYINYASSDGIRFNPDNKAYRINIDFPYLLQVALSDNKPIYVPPAMKKAFSKDSLCLCFMIISEQAMLRLNIYIQMDPTVLNSLIVKYTELIRKVPIARPYLEKALVELSILARKIFKRRTKSDIGGSQNPNLDKGQDLGRGLWGLTYNAAMKAFPGSVEEDLVTAADYNKSQKARNVPLTVYQMAVEEELPGYRNLRKQEERLRKQGINEETEKKIKKERFVFTNFITPFPWIVKEMDKKDEIPAQYVSTPADQEITVISCQEGEIIRNKLKECKERIFKRSAAGKAYIDYVLENIDNKEDFTNREIADATGFNEDVISRVRTRLKSSLSKKVL
jgi:hypothetical protein